MFHHFQPQFILVHFLSFIFLHFIFLFLFFFFAYLQLEFFLKHSNPRENLPMIKYPRHTKMKICRSLCYLVVHLIDSRSLPRGHAISGLAARSTAPLSRVPVDEIKTNRSLLLIFFFSLLLLVPFPIQYFV